MGVEIKGVNLIVDTNYVLFRNVYYLAKNNILYGELENSLIATFENYLKLYRFNKIYMVSDSKSSWRKRIYPEYKAGRKEKRDGEDVDWEFVFNTYDKFKSEIGDTLKSSKIELIEGDNIEGDDWINYLINRSNKNNYSVLYIASDKDLNQKLDLSIVPTWINVQYYENMANGKVYFPRGYKIFFDELEKGNDDIFSLNDNFEFLQFLKSLIDKNKFEEIDKELSLFVKIISGDRGDNISSVLKIPTKTNPNNFMGIGDAGAIKIYDKYKKDYPFDIDFTNDKWLDEVKHYCLDYKKVLDEKVLYETMLENSLKQNRDLIHLHESHLPNDILEKIKSIG